MRTQDHPVQPADRSNGDSLLAQRFVTALAAKDATALQELFCSQVDFRALTPGRSWEAATAESVVGDVIFGAWFEPSDVIERIESIESGVIGSRRRIGYRLQVSNPDGAFTVEQQAYVDLDGGKISWLRLVCSGFVPVMDSGHH
jgi:hypothetical protein